MCHLPRFHCAIQLRGRWFASIYIPTVFVALQNIPTFGIERCTQTCREYAVGVEENGLMCL